MLGSPASAAVTIADDGAAASGGVVASRGENLQSTPGNPNPSGSQTAAADKRAPQVTLSAKKIQKAFKAKLLALVAKCDENCSLAVVAKAGKVGKAITLAKVKVKSARGAKTKLKVKLSKQALAKLAKLVKSGKVNVTVSVVASDAAGNTSKVARAVTVRR